MTLFEAGLPSVPTRPTPNAMPVLAPVEMDLAWRALLLCIKAKFEAVESGIASFEDEFAMWVILPDGSTVADHVAPADAYGSGRMLTSLLARPAATADR